MNAQSQVANKSELQTRTRNQLLHLAKKLGVRMYRTVTKDELIDTLLARQAEGRRVRSAKKSPRFEPEPAVENQQIERDRLQPSEPAIERPTARPPPVVQPEPSAESTEPKVAARPVAAAAKAAVPEPPLKEMTELPAVYGQTRLTLMEVDPYWVHAYWEITTQDREAAATRLDGEAARAIWVLRFYDVTHIRFDGNNAHSFFDQTIDLIANNWYVNLWSSEKSYCAEIGPRAPSGRFVPLCRSNFVQTPRAGASWRYEPDLLKVEGRFEKVERLAQPAPVEQPRTVSKEPKQHHAPAPAVQPARPETLKATAALSPPKPTPSLPAREQPTRPVSEGEIRQHYAELLAVSRPDGHGEQPAISVHVTMPTGGPPSPGPGETPVEAEQRATMSSESVSSFGSGGFAHEARPSIALQLNAEVIVYGRAQLGQTVQVNGHWVKMNADGTFRVQWALPVATKQSEQTE